MTQLAHLFSELTTSPVLRVLLVIGLGLLLGNIPFPGGFKLGVAAVLFAGLALGALSPGFTVPAVLQDLGLILFVYAVGLQTGPGFFRSFRRDGIRLNTAIAVALGVAFVTAILFIRLGHQSADTIAGLFCGSLTNTPALGATIEAIGRDAGAVARGNAVVVGYGVAYPFAIMVVLSFIQFLVWRERNRAVDDSAVRPLQVRTLRIKQADGHTWTARKIEEQFPVRVTRVRPPHGAGGLSVDQDALRPGTLITLVGSPIDLEKVIETIGYPSAIHLHNRPGELEAADFYVSNPEVCGETIGHLEEDYGGVIISRIRRGDVEMAASPTLTLHPGDEVRVVVDRSRFESMARFFGNSISTLSETCYLTFIVGILLGLLLGQVPIPLPGLAAPLHLGMAGGPLVVGIFLGWMGRTGPLLWTMPYALNLGIRNFGILLFLGAVGANAGSSLPSALQTQGPALIGMAIALVAGTHLIAWIVMKIMGEKDLAGTIGALSGLQTQPAALSFAAARASAEKVQVGYASVYPLATILKIILAQVLLGLR